MGGGSVAPWSVSTQLELAEFWKTIDSPFVYYLNYSKKLKYRAPNSFWQEIFIRLERFTRQKFIYLGYHSYLKRDFLEKEIFKPLVRKYLTGEILCVSELSKRNRLRKE